MTWYLIDHAKGKKTLWHPGYHRRSTSVSLENRNLFFIKRAKFKRSHFSSIKQHIFTNYRLIIPMHHFFAVVGEYKKRGIFFRTVEVRPLVVLNRRGTATFFYDRLFPTTSSSYHNVDWQFLLHCGTVAFQIHVRGFFGVRTRSSILYSFSVSTQYYLTWKVMSTRTGIGYGFNSKKLWTVPSKEQYLPSYCKRVCVCYLKETNPRRLLPVEVSDFQLYNA